MNNLKRFAESPIYNNGAFTKPLDQLYQVRGYTPVTLGSASGYTTVVKQMPRAGTSS